MKLWMSVAARSKGYTPDEELLPLIFKWVFGSAATRNSVVEALMRCNIRPEYTKGGTMYRQISLPQKVAESLVANTDKPNTILLQLKNTPLSSWTTNQTFAKHFIAAGQSASKTIVLLKRTIKREECLIYLPAFVRNSNLMDDDYKAVAKAKFKQFMQRMSAGLHGEAEAIVLNNDSNLAVRKKDIMHLNHTTTKFTGLSRKIKAAFPEAKVEKLNDALSMEYKTSSRRIQLQIRAEGFAGTVTYSSQGVSKRQRVQFLGTPTVELLTPLMAWLNSRSVKAVPYALVKTTANEAPAVTGRRRIKPATKPKRRAA